MGGLIVQKRELSEAHEQKKIWGSHQLEIQWTENTRIGLGIEPKRD